MFWISVFSIWLEPDFDGFLLSDSARARARPDLRKNHWTSTILQSVLIICDPSWVECTNYLAARNVVSHFVNRICCGWKCIISLKWWQAKTIRSLLLARDTSPWLCWDPLNCGKSRFGRTCQKWPELVAESLLSLQSVSSGWLIGWLVFWWTATPFWRDGQPPEDMNVSEDEDVEFECNVNGFPRPTITWMINGEPLGM